ncbi:hypothetical protein MKUB_14510 [Mycobacterium kubicae]|uniref:NB-ARC domain-containing protein n=1 Tax=Mycobacterium kubicae TaxID=120959 RepID=A0AAX1JCV9_9MYCO|nr:NB-ARC domain-containing protein [Mycobacterium kubicae]MCV7095802.1 hypothetical protein [Mycobacterium kubicae]QNI11170.1 hypothetical protein GAN18_08095 [Mycobacterium kubicae]QPI39384.1 hypothetical protein I2456_07960 [Mycobacterium kubicae]GFG63961.1 hypothetical protein MKUB_14510 [Mycobacterium kubicae]
MAGGNQSAFGYRYQYLATIERFLRYMRDHLGELAAIALHVEPTTLMREGIARDDDIIDFAIESDDEIVERAQVKGSSNPEGNKLYHGEADTVFERLNGERATCSVLVTNRPLGPTLQQRCSQTLDTDDIEKWDYVGPDPDDATPATDSLMVVDKRSIEDLTEAIADLVRQFRSDQALGQGSVSCRIVAKLLLDRVFQSAAGDGPTKFVALEIVSFMSIPDPDIAHVVGSFDWGVPVNGIPVLPATVTRLHLLEKVYEAIGRPGDGHQVKHLVAQGLTGYGKSSLAAHFCHLYRNSYEFICWIDCSDTGLIESNIRRFVQELTQTELPLSIDPSERFREALASHRGPWLVVFDGLPARVDIDRFMPTQGNGSVLVTTTNETSWWPSSTILSVGTFTEEEATACFASYAGLNDASAQSDAVKEVVARLGSIPLAIAMAALYFRNAAGTIEELSADYFAELEALEDIGARPPGFDRTAFAAIEHAVRHLGAGVIGHDNHDVKMVEGMLYRAALLAPDMIPLNYLIASMPEDMQIRLGRLPEPSFADSAQRRRYISIMRTQSIAHRVLLLDDDGEQNEASDTVDIHPLVHEILQRLFVRRIPPARLSEQITMMMYILHGWIAHARRRSQYFVVDQLVAHAISLLKAIDKLGNLPTLNHQHASMFLYTKSWLKLEVSTCRMSRGDIYASVNLAREVLQELWTHPSDPAREALALQAASSIVVDLNDAGTDAATMRPWALYALRATITCEVLSAKGAALAFEKAYLIRSSLNARAQYRGDAVIASVIHELDEMIARDPSDELRPNAVMDDLVKKIDAGELGDSLDEMLATLRKTVNDYDKHTFDCIEVDIALRRRQFDEAFRAIDELVTRPLHQTHGARPLSRGLVNIYRTLEMMITTDIGPVEEMRLKSSQVRARAGELHQQIISQDGE